MRFNSKNLLVVFNALVYSFVFSNQSYAFFMDGSGHYSLRGETRVNPEFAKDRGTYQVTQQSFDLNGEARMSDKAGFNFRLGLFDNPRAAYLGNDAQPEDCDARQQDLTYTKPENRPDDDKNQPYKPRNDNPERCKRAHQDSGNPRYQKLQPYIREAYAKYATDYCLIEAGRRSRDHGLGLLLSSGKKPFEYDASIFDGVTCDVNVQKTQVLGFSLGFDKLQESAHYSDPYLKTTTGNKGASSSGDDLDQYFFKITYDDSKANLGQSFTRVISIYFSNAMGADSKTDLKYLDVYSGLFFGNFAFRNELLFRLGRSADPNWGFYGAKTGEEAMGDGTLDSNKLDATGLAGNFEWTFSKSGSLIGPPEYNQGTVKKHSTFFEYAYAPGDANGYYQNRPYMNDYDRGRAGSTLRTASAKGMAFHRNFKPALLFFNGPADSDDLRVDGAYNPSRFMNATLYAFGYRYESIENGNFEAKLITAQLNEGVPSGVKDYYNSPVNSADQEPSNYRDSKPTGFYGKSLGYELDLKYSYSIGREFELNVNGAIALPGKAYQTLESQNPTMGYLIQGGGVFKF